MHKKRTKITIVLTLALAAILFFTGCAKNDSITIGSKDFGENIVIAEMLSQLVETHTDLKVNRKLNLGGTFVNFNAIKNNQIDLYPEYTGTGLTAHLKMDVVNDPDESYRIVSEEFVKQWDIVWLEPFGFNNTYTLAVTPEVYEKYGVETYSDLIPYAGEMVFGAEHEFFDRQDGFDGLVEMYGLNFKGEPMKLNASLKYQAIGRGDMDVTDAFATDGPIKQYSLKILEDDLGFFPPYHAAPIVRKEVLDKHPELKSVLNMLAGKLDDATMTELNYLVDVEGKAVEQVAKEFLTSLNLV
ncbi:MAG: glycine betaine ABC transporter substrate-binding protein [Sphaerochaeta sp.]|jgi:osmoprotectant transport system substrate-binding protein|uniref:Glycine/betaine ABC transporter substrate-binding protein n=1 Tax=Sphaerochaeta associata TaxID=1129264 RepID=A0ABY4DCU4_9SPIR|nr:MULTISPECIES: glycine betaine ABC transporter substrate-binding protein [Sphaerochaeta]MDD4038629.1 glycine betaine ABC transporter substrate-binding protein [Sphaerochaeta sp.]MDX9983339.1 glycine betaine ABC transporter substrate-binding protein [Sphaerochaeta sp.]UOM51895.1 glycine/betaine ABC transporter substrate-binding protein [Sphaerochaeta associata]SMP58741.1 osmoprotectant transport system substrate-binding protein [Sphaerochaeta associata]